VTVSDLAKCSMTQSTRRSLCRSWTSCWSTERRHNGNWTYRNVTFVIPSRSRRDVGANVQ